MLSKEQRLIARRNKGDLAGTVDPDGDVANNTAARPDSGVEVGARATLATISSQKWWNFAI